MAQVIKVQDGKVTYSASDSTYSVDFGINGQLNVTKQLNVGDNPTADGVISPAVGQDIIVLTNGGNISLQAPAKSILFNNVAWPDTTVTPVVGMYVGVSGTNVLQYKSFILATVANDTMTTAQLNSTYPSATPGQMVVGLTVLYICVGTSLWRKITAPVA